MKVILLLIKSVAIISGLALLAGLYKPWIVLWWEDIQNRKKVLRLYGIVFVISFSIYLLLIKLFE